MEQQQANRLIDEKSPYLLKHAYNPVDWYPWGDDAMDAAKKGNKPIFLSIGYSACHWCNVMEQESWSDPEIGALMNDTFVSIKVDREERPDLDSIYMAFCSIVNSGGCGWPLNVILTPDGKPFFAASYIPKNSRYGMMGLTDLAPKIKELWLKRPAEVEESAGKLSEILRSGSFKTGGKEPDAGDLDHAFEVFAKLYDAQNGGFGTAPKFPSPHNIYFLLRYWNRTGNKAALEMAQKTLTSMRLGGLFDQVGFGFHRYSTDAVWLVPHFEKMLYTQALLGIAYLETYQATGDPFYKKTAEEVFTYVLRDMTAARGGFYSSEDADTDGEEGKFYFWTLAEVRRILPHSEADFVQNIFNLENDGNFADPATGDKTGNNLLHLLNPPSEIMADSGMGEKEFYQKFDRVRRKLFIRRGFRTRPAKDDKILTDWNGLMIAALAKGYKETGNRKYLKVSEKAADFILKNMRGKDGLLLHRYRGGESAISGMLDDYAYFVWGLTELYEADFKLKYLRAALELNDLQLKHFWDEKNGGFYFAADLDRKETIPWKDFNDGDLPSGNSISMLNLLRLGRFTGNASFDEKAVVIGRLIQKEAADYPPGYTQALVGVDFGLGPSYEIVIAGKSGAADAGVMLGSLHGKYLPNSVTIFREDGDEEIATISKFAENQRSQGGKATAYVCQNFICNLPTTDPEKMMKELDRRPGAR